MTYGRSGRASCGQCWMVVVILTLPPAPFPALCPSASSPPPFPIILPSSSNRSLLSLQPHPSATSSLFTCSLLFLPTQYHHRPFPLSRHAVVMELMNAYPLCQVHEVQDPSKLYSDLVSLILKFASFGLIHGDFNEFNLMLDDDDKLTGKKAVCNMKNCEIIRPIHDCISRLWMG